MEDVNHSVLFRELPNDVGRECLLRASFETHENLKCVCEAWENVISSEGYYRQRRISGHSEVRICLVHAQGMQGTKEGSPTISATYGISTVDPVTGIWESLPPMPGFEHGMPLFSEYVAVKRKLVVIGGWDPSTWQSMSSVFVFDFLTSKWRRGADMPTVRFFFACAASEKEVFVYVAGGHDESKNALKSAEVYDADTDKWKTLPTMSEERDECAGVFADGNFVVVSGYSSNSQGAFTNTAEVYSPTTSTWSTVDGLWTSGTSARGCVGCDGKHLVCASGKEVSRCVAGQNEWTGMDKFAEGVSESVRCVYMNDEKMMVCCESGSEGKCFLRIKERHASRWQCIQRPTEHQGHVQCAAIVEI